MFSSLEFSLEEFSWQRRCLLKSSFVACCDLSFFSSLLPHITKYSPITIKTEPIILQKTIKYGLCSTTLNFLILRYLSNLSHFFSYEFLAYPPLYNWSPSIRAAIIATMTVWTGWNTAVKRAPPFSMHHICRDSDNPDATNPYRTKIRYVPVKTLKLLTVNCSIYESKVA